MKKTIILLAALIISFSAFSQQRTRSFMGWHLAKDAPAKLNELKLNLPMTIFGSSPEISYERILNSDISVGASILGSFNIDNNPYQVIFTPYFRWFFGGSSTNLQKYGAGFFIEANGAIYSQQVSTNSYIGNNNTSETKSEVGSGLGMAIGWKFLSKNNWVGEIYGGAGRNFIKSDYVAVGAYPRIGISIGKRF
ncbi:MAG: hypothetical protein Q4G63_12750 [Bacteroidia bacterium]|nr:hypothetical protein [Bacteroidia bacterium]